MRVTNEMMYRMLSGNTAATKEAAYKIQEQTASGKKVVQASDDPSAFAKIKQLKTDLAKVQRYAENATSAENDLLNLDTILQNVTSIMQSVSEAAVSAGNSTSENLSALAAEVDQLLENLVDLANSRDEDGNYIFSGLKSDMEAYAVTRTDGKITSVSYQGDTGVKETEIGKNSSVAVSIPGSDFSGANGVFQTSEVDLFSSLIQLRDSLLAGEDVTGSDTLSEIDAGLDHVVDVLSAVGAREERVTLQQDLLSDRETNLETAIDDKESIDLAEAAIELSAKQTAYESAVAVTSKILNQSSLVDYL